MRIDIIYIYGMKKQLYLQQLIRIVLLMNYLQLLKTVKDRRGIITENFYDDLHRPVRTERDGIRTKTNEYDDAGNLTAVVDAKNNRTEQTYNKRNLLETTTHPDGKTRINIYDGVGNILSTTNEESKVTTYTYDKENRQTSVEFAGEKTVKTYDALGNPLSVTKPSGNIRKMTYDGLKRLITVVDDPNALNLTTRYEYDSNGNLRHQYDARGNDVEFTYDSLNRKKQHIQYKTSGDLVTRYSYDEEGNLTSLTDPKGQVLSYIYDELNRQTNANYPAVTTPYITLKEIRTGYDANNNVVSITETKTAANNTTVTDSTVNNYDNFDRLKDSTQRGMKIDYGYDINGNRTSVTTPSGSTTYDFDNRNRLKTATANSLVTNYTYYPDGKKDTVTYPNGTEMKYTYHPSNRISSVTNSRSGSLISGYIYDYDPNGNRISQTETQSGVTETTTYNYDSADRMKDFTLISGMSTTVTQYTFEGYNRKTEKVTENNTVIKNQTYTYDETDWIMNIADSVKQSAISYDYDNNGNMIRKADSLLPNGETTFEYDSRNKPVQTKRGPPGSVVVLGQYDYNAAGLRVRHRLSERGDVDYYYDGNAVIEEHNATDNSLLAHYRYADRLLSLDTGNGVQYYHYDALGSTVNLTDAGGATQVSYNLNPWGFIRRQIGSSVNRHIFTGQETDFNTGLIYFGARYYDPDTARFITQDSYLGEAGTPPSLNRYLYAYGNPTVYVDLMGYYSWDEFKNDVTDAQKLFDTVSLFNPIRLQTKLASAGLEFVNRKIDEYAENNVLGDKAIAGLTIAKTLTTISKSFVDTQENIENQVFDFTKDPQWKTIPIVGTQMNSLITSSYKYGENPNLLTGSEMVGNAFGSLLMVMPFAPKGAKIGASAGAAEASAVEANVAGQAAAAKIPILTKITGEVETVMQKLKTAYEQSPAGNEVGSVGPGTREVIARDKLRGGTVAEVSGSGDEILGGAYNKVPNNGGQKHHMPADSVSPYSTNKGPSVRMETQDHMETASWGRSKEANAYRAKQKELIDKGKFEEAQKMDIDNLRNLFNDKYENGIQQMIDYTKKLLSEKNK